MRLIFASEQGKVQSRNRTGDKGTKSRRNREGGNLGKTRLNTEKTYYHVIKGQKHEKQGQSKPKNQTAKPNFVHHEVLKNQHPNSIKLDIVKALWYNGFKVVEVSRASKTRSMQFINTCLCFGVMTIIKENEMSKVNSRLEMDIAQLLDYMWETEQTHYEEVKDDMQNPEQHIFMTMQRIRDAIWGELNEPSE